MDETETQDFMNVESFSQLPFIRRPSSSKEKNPKHVRLFGKDFTSQEDYSESKNKEDEEQEEEVKDKDQEDQTGKDDSISNNNNNNNRRFECHYCFRNFPTSQALGGHQNAHKRERQLAKRGASSYFHHPDPNLYGYRHYPSWTSGPLPSSRFYGGGPPSSSYYSRPINGSPLGSQWRVPPSSSSSVQGVYNSNSAFTSHHHSSSSSNSTLPFLASSNTQPQPPSHTRGSAAQNRMSSYRYGLNPNVQDHVSLDLHL